MLPNITIQKPLLKHKESNRIPQTTTIHASTAFCSFQTSTSILGRMAPSAGSKAVVLMCTGVPENKQNELYLLAQDVDNGQLVRDKVAAGMYDVRTSHMVVGSNLRRTDKLLCALAAGIPIVQADYVKKSHKEGRWHEVGSFDVGKAVEQDTDGGSKLYIPPLAMRQAKKREGGVFQGWIVVVLLEDPRQKEIYRRMLELGGAIVHRWTLTHLLHSQEKAGKDYKSLTHVVARPAMLLEERFRGFLDTNDRGPGGPSVVTTTYVGDFLTKKVAPFVSMYDVRNPEQWPLVEESWKVEELQSAHPLRIWRAPTQHKQAPWHHAALNQLKAAVQQQEQEEEPSPCFSPHREDFSIPEISQSQDTMERIPEAKRRRISTQDEEEEIEVLNVVQPSASSQTPQSTVARLKARAAELIKKEKQSRIDSWVNASPKASQEGGSNQIASPESPVHQEPSPDNDTIPTPLRRNEGLPNSPMRRTSSNNAATNANHFLGLRRSGSTSSARSLFDSDVSQDGIDCDSIKEGASKVDGIKAKSTFCHTFQVMRRIKGGFEVSEEGRNYRMRDAHRLGPDPEPPAPLTRAMCQNIWTCLDSREMRVELDLEQDVGWIAGLDLVKKLVNHSRFLPVAALHRLLQEALVHHGEVSVREAAVATLEHCFDCLPPSQSTAHYYLELMARKCPHVDTLGHKWEFDPQEPLLFLESIIDKAEEKETPGAALCLQLIVDLLERDLQSWSDMQLKLDSLSTPSWRRPLLSHVLFPQGIVKWGSSLQKICTWYARSLSSQSPELTSSLRTLLGLGAQLVANKERACEPLNPNEAKTEMARFLAKEMAVHGLNKQRMSEELFMLKPDWLAFLLSTSLLERLCNQQSEKNLPSLRYLINNFINIPLILNSEGDKENAEKENPAPSSPLAKLALNSPSRNPRSPRPILNAKKIHKIDVTRRNKYGEVPLHGYAKRGNLSKMQECLATPGVDVNAVDHAGWTPLHEAVASGSKAAVSLLLNHSAPRTLLHYWSPVKPKVDTGKVDLLLGDMERGMNPLHEAVSHDNNEMVSLFLETATGKPGFPSLKVLLSAKTKTGDTMLTLAKSESMKATLNRYRYTRDVSQKKSSSHSSLNVNDLGMFKVLLDQALIKYISALNLAAVYSTFKEINYEEVLSEANKGTSILPNASQQQFCGSIDLREGLKSFQFGKKPRFDLSRSEMVKSRDLRDLEQLLYFKKQKKFSKMEKEKHPVSATLILMKTS